MEYLMELSEFIQHYTLYEPQFMWFLGAGAPRSAGLPTAYDIIWDLKKRYYTTHENIDITEVDETNEFVRNKIQDYMDSKGFPRKDSAEEYSFYFEQSFGTNYDAQRQYLRKKLIEGNFKPNIGYRILGALLYMKKTPLVFSTNFDNILETAYSNVTSSVLNSYNLEGSEAAVNALTNSSFPFYVKLHGDFQYKSVKNLERDLRSNDEQLEKSFISAASRFGIVVTGYSGRDSNVMNMFYKALDETNPFPRGLFWTTSSRKNCLPCVEKLIEMARSKGVQAEIIEVNTFDDLLIRIWKQVENKPKEFLEKIQIKKYSTNEPVIESSEKMTFPIIRLNAFPILSLPSKCLKIRNCEIKTLVDLKNKLKEVRTGAIFTRTTDVLAWGSEADIKKVIPEISQIEVEHLTVESIKNNTYIHNFVYRALVYALSKNLPVVLKKKKNIFYLVVDPTSNNSAKLSKLKEITYNVNGFCKNQWAECLEIRLEYKNDQYWVVITPDIWIEPVEKKQEMKDFIINRKKKRYNPVQNQLLDCWRDLLFENNKTALSEFKSYNFEDDITNPSFTISPITAYSWRSK